jgi:hypothetical protein
MPNRLWSEISIDFVIDLLLSKRCLNLMIIIDRLGKEVILKEIKDIIAEVVIDAFVRWFYRYYFLLDAIVSD